MSCEHLTPNPVFNTEYNCITHMIYTGPSVRLLLSETEALCQKWAYFHAAFVLADQSESPQRVEQGSLKHTDKASSSDCFTLVSPAAAAARVFVTTEFSNGLGEEIREMWRGRVTHGGATAGCQAASALFRTMEKKRNIANCNPVTALSPSVVSVEVHSRWNDQLHPLITNSQFVILDKAKTSLSNISFYNWNLLHTWSFCPCPNLIVIWALGCSVFAMQ